MDRRIFTGLVMLAALFCWISAAEYAALLFWGKETKAIVTYSQRKISRNTTYENYYEFNSEDGSLFSGYFTAGKAFRSVSIRYLKKYPSIHSPGTNGVLIFWGGLWFAAGGVIVWLRIASLKKKKYFQRDPGAHVTKKEILTLPGEWGVPLLVVAAGMAVWVLFISEIDWLGIRKKPEIITGKTGNTQGNLSSGGEVAAEGQRIYIQSPGSGADGGIYKMKADLTARVKLTDDKSFYLNVLDGWLYYCNFYEEMNIYRISSEGRKRKRLVSDRAEELHVMGDWLFFINASDHKKLYRAKTDGGSLTKLNNDPSSNINLSGEWIYYITEEFISEGKVYRIRNNGQGREKISDEPVQRILVDGDWIFYISPRDDQTIYKMKTDGTGRMKLNDSPSWDMNMTDGKWLFYGNNDDGRIYKIPADGGSPICLNEDDSAFLHIAGAHIYYRPDFPSENSGHFIRISLDGSHREVITF
jgi:hypothetical protein